MRVKPIVHPVEAEALAFFETRLQTVFEAYFRSLRERVVALAEHDGILPVTFWMCERDELMGRLSPIFEAGVRLGMELERSPRASLNTFVNFHVGLQETVDQLACEAAQEITVSAARRICELLNLGLNPRGLPERLRDELRLGILSDSQAHQAASQQAARVIASGQLFAPRALPMEVVSEPLFYAERVCI